ncbi:hypothetical protein I4F81_008028 [Pyropia yezoensis]|uniref:Uncharacterized protein n=1 Tax=Pyropia yezoensis TaxID=2788 RepID=A0ACC3C6R5_PYRYE|nr:hypothetical protein I4F81_008028 [Neopyropia yezoensis]
MARSSAAAGRPADDDPRRPDAAVPFVLQPVPLEQADTSSELYVLLCFFSGLLCFTFHMDHYALLMLLFFFAHIAAFRPSTGDATQTAAVTMYVGMVLYRQFIDPSILSMVPGGGTRAA